MSKIAAIVLAAGTGSRMKSDCPKQFMLIDDKPVVYYSLKVFSECEYVDKIVLVTSKKDIEFCQKEIIEKYNISKVEEVVEGGTERYWSVLNGLNKVRDCEYVLIHDGARPCITEKMILESIEMVQKTKACTVGVPVKDTIKIVDEEGNGIETPRRDRLWQIQTPQSFEVSLLCSAYDKMRKSNVSDITDDTMIVERFEGVKTKVLQGSYSNIKLTTPDDFDVIKIFLRKNEKRC